MGPRKCWRGAVPLLLLKHQLLVAGGLITTGVELVLLGIVNPDDQSRQV
jgi:hypothetical protein